jgi:hypothetical protein
MWALNRPAQAAFATLVFATLGRRLGGAFLALCLVVEMTSAGFYSGRPWALRLAIAIFAIRGIGDGFGFLETHDLL